MRTLESRYDRRQTGLEPLTLQSVVTISAARAETWRFLVAPEAAVLTEEGVVRSFHVPGTPPGGPGAQQCIVYEVGGRLTAHIAELVVAEPPSRIVSRWLTTPTELMGSYLLADGKQGETVLTCQLGLRVAVGSSKKVAPKLQAQLEASLRRVRTAIESGVRFPSQADG